MIIVYHNGDWQGAPLPSKNYKPRSPYFIVDDINIERRIINGEPYVVNEAKNGVIFKTREELEKERLSETVTDGVDVIDFAATKARRRYTSPDKDATYKAKQEEVERWIKAKRPKNPKAGRYPYIQAEAEMKGLTVTEVAENIEAIASQWSQLDPYIEALAITGKDKLRKATTVDEAEAIIKEFKTSLDSV